MQPSLTHTHTHAISLLCLSHTHHSHSLTHAHARTHAHTPTGLDYGGANSQHMVWLDANMDGAIDVILFAKPPSEEQSDVIGAELYLSTGYHKRQWTLQKNSTLSELSSTAILTDLDGESVYKRRHRACTLHHLTPQSAAL